MSLPYVITGGGTCCQNWFHPDRCVSHQIGLQSGLGGEGGKKVAIALSELTLRWRVRGKMHA